MLCELDEAKDRFARSTESPGGLLRPPDVGALAEEIEKASHSPATTTSVYLRGLIAAAGKLWGQDAIDRAEEIVAIVRKPREATDDSDSAVPVGSAAG